MKLLRPLAAVTLVALGAVGGAAQARDNVFWSIGIAAAPGVSVGVSNMRPVVVAPAPVYVAPRPVYVAPPPVYYAPRPVVLVQQPVYVVRHKHKHKHRHWD